MPSSVKPCGCGFGHTRKSLFGKSADAFFSGAPDPKACLTYNYRENQVPLVRFGSAGKTRFGPMSIGKKSKN